MVFGAGASPPHPHPTSKPRPPNPTPKTRPKPYPKPASSARFFLDGSQLLLWGLGSGGFVGIRCPARHLFRPGPARSIPEYDINGNSTGLQRPAAGDSNGPRPGLNATQVLRSCGCAPAAPGGGARRRKRRRAAGGVEPRRSTVGPGGTRHPRRRDPAMCP